MKERGNLQILQENRRKWRKKEVYKRKNSRSVVKRENC